MKDKECICNRLVTNDDGSHYYQYAPSHSCPAHHGTIKQDWIILDIDLNGEPKLKYED